MTNRQLAVWVSKGHGQIKYAKTVITCWNYQEGYDNSVVRDEVLIRPYGHETWLEPILPDLNLKETTDV